MIKSKASKPNLAGSLFKKVADEHGFAEELKTKG
jgi:hypothetical protein